MVQGGQKVAAQANLQDLDYCTTCQPSYHRSAVKLSIREKSTLCSPCGPAIRYHWTSQTFLINQIRSDFIGQPSKYTWYRFHVVLLGQLSSARLTRSALHTPPKYALSDQNRPDLHSSTCLAPVAEPHVDAAITIMIFIPHRFCQTCKLYMAVYIKLEEEWWGTRAKKYTQISVLVHMADCGAHIPDTPRAASAKAASSKAAQPQQLN